MEGMSRFVPVEQLFAGRHFDAEIVVLCVRWSFKLSYRDLVTRHSESIVVIQQILSKIRRPRVHLTLATKR